jgi:hypothetical protein
MRSPCLTVAVLLLVAISCKKDGLSLLDTPAEYHKSGKTKKGGTMIFALSGEIKNASTINRFENFDNSWLEDLGNALYPNPGRADSIRVYSPKQVAINDNYRYKSYDVKTSGNNILLTARDTTTGMSYHEVFTRTIHYYIALNKPPVFREYLVTSTAGLFGFGYTTLQQFYLQTEGGQFKIPWIIGVVHYANGSTASLTVQNKLDNNFYKNLGAGDTVVLHTYDVYYTK